MKRSAAARPTEAWGKCIAQVKRSQKSVSKSYRKVYQKCIKSVSISRKVYQKVYRSATKCIEKCIKSVSLRLPTAPSRIEIISRYRIEIVSRISLVSILIGTGIRFDTIWKPKRAPARVKGTPFKKSKRTTPKTPYWGSKSYRNCIEKSYRNRIEIFLSLQLKIIGIPIRCRYDLEAKKRPLKGP